MQKCNNIINIINRAAGDWNYIIPLAFTKRSKRSRLFIFSTENDQTIRAYNKRASSYEAKWQAYLDHTHKAFLRSIETSVNDAILDISGGTGLLAQMLAEQVYTDRQRVLNRCYGLLQPRKLYLLDWNRAGFFRLVNAILKLTASEHIDTRSLSECKKMLSGSNFIINKSDSWNWRYWKFFFCEDRKTGRAKFCKIL